MKNKIEVVFTLDKNYLKPLSVAIASILKNADKTSFLIFNIVHTGIDIKYQLILEKLKKLNANCEFNFINFSNYADENDLKKYLDIRDDYHYITPSTYFRFYLPQILSDKKKVLHLDIDVIVLEDLWNLYNTNIEDYYAGVINDGFMEYALNEKLVIEASNQTFEDYLLKYLGKESTKYFNAGVILYNLDKIRQDNITDKLWEFVKTKSPLKYQDQDVLNAVLENNVLYVEDKWDTFPNFYTTEKGIIHYVGENKPWNSPQNDIAWHFWWKYCKFSPFRRINDFFLYVSFSKKIKIEIFNIRIFEFLNTVDTLHFYIFGIKTRIKRRNTTTKNWNIKWPFISKPKDKKIKVGLLIDEFFGGAGTAFGGYGFLARKYVCKYVPNEDIQVDVLLYMDGNIKKTKCENIDNTNVYILPGITKFAKQFLKKQNYDLFMSIEMTYPSYEIMNLIDSKKLILWIQDPRPEEVWEEKRQTMSDLKDPCICDPRIPVLIQKLYAEKRIKFISQGYSLNPLAKQLYKLPEDVKVQYLPNPIEIDFNYKFDIKNKKKQVIFLGRLEAQKRAWLFCEVARRMPEYDFYVMGKFFRDEENNKKPLQQYLDNTPSNLYFMGHMEGEEKEKLIRESRILLNTSIWEGIPISWLEALQYGTCIVSCLDNENLPSRFGNYVGEILGDGYDKADLFIPAIKELMENDELYSQKANSAIEYIRENHNVIRFIDNIRETINSENTRIIDTKNRELFPKPLRNYLDVKITYACNFKCEYCYQTDENGIRQTGMLSKEDAQNLVKFTKLLGEQYYVTLAGGEPFVYPYLNYLGKELSKQGHIVNLITNFSAPFEKIEEFVKLTNKNLGPFSISLHLSQYKDMNEVYDKLRKLIDLKKNLNLDFPILLTCVLTEENFEKLKEVDDYINKNFNLPLEIQRVYDKNGYTVYNQEIEDFMKKRGLDVPVERANNNNFSGRYCWCGSKFFYIESDGNVKRCYTDQYPKNLFNLGKLKSYKKIRIFDGPVPCFSRRNCNCICYKHFERQKFITDIQADNQTIGKYLKLVKFKKQLKYNIYRFLTNVTLGELKQKMIAKKKKYSN